MGERRKAREIAMQMLYQADMGKQQPLEVRRVFWKSREDESGNQTVEPDTREFAEELFQAATDRSDEVDDLIEKHAQNWRISRMAAVDRNLLRMAVAEMLAYRATPHPIIINEALEIARRYTAPESITFLNGVLDAVARAVLAKRLA